MMDRCAFGPRKVKLAFPHRHAPHIELVWCNIKVAAQQHVAVAIAGLVKEPSQPLQPVELERKLVCPQLSAVWDVCIDDPNAVDGTGDQTLWLLIVIVMKAFLNILDLILRKYRDAVVRLLSEERG